MKVLFYIFSGSQSSCDSLPNAVQQGLEDMRGDLTNLNPSFTIRRQMLQAQKHNNQIIEMRKVQSRKWESGRIN